MENTQENTAHLARLARLSLTDEELALYTTQIADILTYVSKLQEVETAEPSKWTDSLGTPVSRRVDEQDSCSSEVRRNLIDAFPSKEGDLLSVQAVFTNRV